MSLAAVEPAPPPRRIFIHTALYSPLVCGPARILQPEKLLNTIPGVRAVSVINGIDLSLSRPEEEKIFIWQRAEFKKPDYLPRQKELLRLGYLILAERDDDPDYFPPIVQNDYVTFTACHGVQTSTDLLGEVFRRHNPNVAVFKNQVPELPPPRQYAKDGPVIVLFGARNRHADGMKIMPALNRLLAKFGEHVRIWVLGDFAFFYALKTPFKEFEDFCSYERYQEVLRGADISLLPLDPTRFNLLKSDLKFIECAAQGVAVVASPAVYEKTIQPEETGLLFHNEAEFEANLQRLIEDAELRHRLANNAYQYVAQSRLLGQHFRERYDWYCSLLDRLPQLNAELKERHPELFED